MAAHRSRALSVLAGATVTLALIACLTAVAITVGGMTLRAIHSATHPAANNTPRRHGGNGAGPDEPADGHQAG